MKADFHLHSSFSADSDTPMRQMVQQGLSLHLDMMCFTEHMDYDYKDEGMLFEADMPSYFQMLQKLKDEYAPKIELLFGIELGLQPYLKERCSTLVREWPFDFIIGSSHVVNGRDPYYPAFFAGRTEQAAYLSYFQSIIDNLHTFSCFDVYGHIDYVVRYGPNKNRFYSYTAYQEPLDEILQLLVEKGIGLELNTGGFQYGLGHPNPHEDILKRYHDLGGEIVTVGSDAHAPERIAADFDKAKQILKACGFRYYTIFRKRRPEYISLQ